MSTVIAEPKRKMTIKEWLKDDGMLAEIKRTLPKHCNADRMARVTMTALTRTPKLAECDNASFFQALLSLSQWGLEPDGRRAHLIPFENRKRGVVECQLIIDYKGLVELAYRSGVVASIHADVVCENDTFAYDMGEIIEHKIDFRNLRGKPYAAYAIARMKDGCRKCEVMSLEDVEAIRRRSKAANNGPWVTDFNEMAKKTVFRRLTKWLPLSAEIQDAVYGDDDAVADTVTVSSVPAQSLDDITLAIGGPRETNSEVQPTSLESLEADNTEAFADFVAKLDLCESLLACQELYDSLFGPDSTIEWSQEDNTEAAERVESRKAIIRGKRGAGSAKQ